MSEHAGRERKSVKLVIVGAGNRGTNYANYALEHADLCQVVAVAEPREPRRKEMAACHGVPDEMTFHSWEQLKVLPKLGDAVVIATLDSMHKEPAIFFAQQGYHILLEKPMAPNEEDCREIVEAVKKAGVIMAIGHVMRYTPYSRKIKQIVDSGALGELISVQHLEPVGWFHFAHSYVRGNWRREDETSSSLLAKSCHDIDWIRWIVGKKCVSTSSFGTLNHFRKEKKPEGAGTRCLDCRVERECPYSAKKIYLERIEGGHTKWPVSVIVDDHPTVANVREALETGPYGRCVYECDNDVMDNQVVNMLFEEGKTASFSMIAFTKEVCTRKTRIFGTRGQLEGDGHRVTTFDFNSLQTASCCPTEEDAKPDTKLTGHDFGDYYLMKDFVDAVGFNDPSFISSTPEETLESHVMVFRAEKARKDNVVASLDW